MDRNKKIVQTSFIGIGGNVLLVAAKAFIGFLSGSIAIITDALNNLTDAISSIVTIIGTKLANRKPDKKHPYGHGRVEYLTSILIAFIILFAGGMAIYESIQSIIQGKKASYDYVSIIIISISIVAKIALGLYFKYVAKKVDSSTLSATGTDALMDALLTSSTLVAIIVALIFPNVNIEGYLGIVIGLFIIKSGITFLRDGLSLIIGERSDKELTDKIIELVVSYPEVIGAYDLILNNYGYNRSIGSIHIEVRDDMTAKEIHPLTRKISVAAYAKFGVILTVGIYARNENDKTFNNIRDEINSIISNYQYIKQLHGLYIDEASHQISFDLIFDFEDKNINNEIKEIRSKIKEKYPEYEYFIVIDKDFSD